MAARRVSALACLRWSPVNLQQSGRLAEVGLAFRSQVTVSTGWLQLLPLPPPPYFLARCCYQVSWQGKVPQGYCGGAFEAGRW